METFKNKDWKFTSTWILHTEAIDHVDKDGIFSEEFKVLTIPGMSYRFFVCTRERRVLFKIVYKFKYESSVATNFSIIVGEKTVNCYEEIATGLDEPSTFGYGVCLSSDGFFEGEKPLSTPDGGLVMKIMGTFSLKSITNKFRECTSAMHIYYGQKDKDFILSAENEFIKVHKWLLEHHSLFFKEHVKDIEGNMFGIQDFPFIIITVAVKYMYQMDVSRFFKCGNVNPIECVAFADKYGMHEFKSYAEAWSISELSKSTVINIANEAVRRKADNVFEASIAFLMNEDDLACLPGIKNLHDEIATEVSRRLLTIVSETLIFYKQEEID